MAEADPGADGGAFKNLDVRLPGVERDGSDALDSRKNQGMMFTSGHPKPGAVILSRVFETA